MIPKFPLVAREEAKDDRRPLVRKNAPGESTGESTLAPFAPFVCLEEGRLTDMMLGLQTGAVMYEIEDCVERLELTDSWRIRADCGTPNGGDRWGRCPMDEGPATEMDAELVSRDSEGTGNLGSVGDKGLLDTDAGFLRDWVDDRDCSTGAVEVE